MSVTVDANASSTASNASDPSHARAKAIVPELGAGPRLVYIFWPIALAYRWIATHPAIVPRPLTSTRPGPTSTS